MHQVFEGREWIKTGKDSIVQRFKEIRYHAILVDKDEYLVPLSRYVHLNPVRAGMVESVEKYPWSSYRGYIGKGKKEDWVEYKWVLSRFDRVLERAEKKLRDMWPKGFLGSPRVP